MARIPASYKRYGPAIVIILFATLINLTDSNPTFAQDVNEAMQSFIQGMFNKNPATIFAAFSRQSPWRYQPYEIGSGRRLPEVTVTPEKMAQDFQQKADWYNFFMEDPDGYTFRVNFIHGKPWKKRGADTFVAPDSSTGNTYVKWRREGPKWVIGEIGETTPN
jgi:hypothetical protein